MRKYIYQFLACLMLLLSTASLRGQTNIVMARKLGGFGDKPGEFRFPTMIAADRTGNVYVVDQHNHRIQKFDSEGNFVSMWGKFGTQPGEFNYPYGVAVDSRGDVYVSDMNNNRIQKFSPDGRHLLTAGTYGPGDQEFKYPYGIAIDADDNLYVIDAFNYRIKKLDANLKVLAQWGSQESIGIKLYMPHEIAVSKDGKLIVTDRQNHRVSIFTKDGKLVGRFGEFGEGAGVKGLQFSEPHGVATGPNGEIFICDRYNFRIQKFSAQKEFQTQWVTSATFDDSRFFPLGIAIGANGTTVYVTDHYDHTVHVYKLL